MFTNHGIDKAISKFFKSSAKNAYSKIDPVFTDLFGGAERCEYLYETWYDELDYDFAEQYFESKKVKAPFGGCSSFRKNNFLCRNYDWYYNEGASFVVHTPAKNGYNATIGVAGNVPSLTDEFVQTKKYSDMYRLVPFMIVDGINDKSVSVSTNVVPTGDKGVHAEIEAAVFPKHRVCSLALPRFILDNFSSALEAVEYIRDYVTVYHPKSLLEAGYEQHYIIADSVQTKESTGATYILEFVTDENGKSVVEIITPASNNEHNYYEGIITNFHIDGVEFGADMGVGTPVTDTERVQENYHITPNGAGLERFNIIVYNWSNLGEKKEPYQALLENLHFSNAYTITAAADKWYSEFVGHTYSSGLTLTVDSTPEEFGPFMADAAIAWTNRNRKSPKVWQTVHSSVYDMNEKVLYLSVQENFNHTYEFKL